MPQPEPVLEVAGAEMQQEVDLVAPVDAYSLAAVADSDADTAVVAGGVGGVANDADARAQQQEDLPYHMTPLLREEVTW